MQHTVHRVVEGGGGWVGKGKGNKFPTAHVCSQLLDVLLGGLKIGEWSGTTLSARPLIIF